MVPGANSTQALPSRAIPAFEAEARLPTISSAPSRSRRYAANVLAAAPRSAASMARNSSIAAEGSVTMASRARQPPQR